MGRRSRGAPRVGGSRSSFVGRDERSDVEVPDASGRRCRTGARPGRASPRAAARLSRARCRACLRICRGAPRRRCRAEIGLVDVDVAAPEAVGIRSAPTTPPDARLRSPGPSTGRRPLPGPRLGRPGSPLFPPGRRRGPTVIGRLRAQLSAVESQPQIQVLLVLTARTSRTGPRDSAITWLSFVFHSASSPSRVTTGSRPGLGGHDPELLLVGQVVPPQLAAIGGHLEVDGVPGELEPLVRPLEQRSRRRSPPRAMSRSMSAFDLARSCSEWSPGRAPAARGGRRRCRSARRTR